MAQYFFKIPFATSGDVTTVPLPSQSGGAVSFTDGFGPDYEALSSDPDVLYPERRVINALYNLITNAVGILQVHGYPDFITTSDNGGTPYSYDANSFVRYSGQVYFSLVDSNTALPSDATKWQPFIQQSVPTGVKWDYMLSTLPAGGWIWMNGGTIGNAASGATDRANADTAALFAALWGDWPQSLLPIQTSTGASSTRGVSAAADFAANKRLPLPDARGRLMAGRDNMGGVSAANRITVAGCGIDGTILGASGGIQNVTLVGDNMPIHSHGVGTIATAPDGQHTHDITIPTGRIQTGGGTIQGQGTSIPSGVALTTDVAGQHTHGMTGVTDSAGAGLAFGIVQPTLICNCILKL